MQIYAVNFYSFLIAFMNNISNNIVSKYILLTTTLTAYSMIIISDTIVSKYMLSTSTLIQSTLSRAHPL